MIHLILILIVVSILIRVITAPFRFGRRYRRWNGYGNGYGYGYNPYSYGCRRHHRLLGGLLPIVALVALDRIFTRRPW